MVSNRSSERKGEKHIVERISYKTQSCVQAIVLENNREGTRDYERVAEY
jgi:hypothetical protein